jgi:hypothetical protein
MGHVLDKMGGGGAHLGGVSMARWWSSGGRRRSSTSDGKAEAGGNSDELLWLGGRSTIIMHEPIWKQRDARAELAKGGCQWCLGRILA